MQATLIDLWANCGTLFFTIGGRSLVVISIPGKDQIGTMASVRDLTNSCHVSELMSPSTLVTPLYLTETPTAPKWRFFTTAWPEGRELQRTRGVDPVDPVENDLWSALAGWVPDKRPWSAATFLAYGWIEISAAQAQALTTPKPTPPAQEWPKAFASSEGVWVFESETDRGTFHFTIGLDAPSHMTLDQVTRSQKPIPYADAKRLIESYKKPPPAPASPFTEAQWAVWKMLLDFIAISILVPQYPDFRARAEAAARAAGGATR